MAYVVVPEYPAMAKHCRPGNGESEGNLRAHHGFATARLDDTPPGVGD